jgi:hypothetical protein
VLKYYLHGIEYPSCKPRRFEKEIVLLLDTVNVKEESLQKSVLIASRTNVPFVSARIANVSLLMCFIVLKTCHLFIFYITKRLVWQ